MNKSVTLILTFSLILALAIGISFVRYPKTAYAQNEDVLPDQNDMEPVIIALTSLDVNDLILDVNDQPHDVNNPTLELRYKIKNNSDQDIWVCKGIGWQGDNDAFWPDYEIYLEQNNTLVVRRRLDVSTFLVWYIWPEGRYVRLRAGQERSESLSLELPVRHRRLFTHRLEKQGITYVRRLVFEIGYHTKDLAKIILELKDSNKDPDLYSEAQISYLHSANEEEHVLRITVDGILIPYEEVMAEFFNAEDEEEDEPQ